VFRIGEIDQFLIKDVYKEKIPICACKKSAADSVAFPCQHIFACYECAEKKKKCEVCKGKIEESIKIIDIYKPAL